MLGRGVATEVKRGALVVVGITQYGVAKLPPAVVEIRSCPVLLAAVNTRIVECPRRTRLNGEIAYLVGIWCEIGDHKSSRCRWALVIGLCDTLGSVARKAGNPQYKGVNHRYHQGIT